jgi:hypothetical protein
VHLQSDTTPGLPAHRAFVMQFHAAADIARGRLMGRGEHVASGLARHFVTRTELLAFIAQVWPSADAGPPGG